jgi:UTP--glucose-1-phosphate uridylyltransferase
MEFWKYPGLGGLGNAGSRPQIALTLPEDSQHCQGLTAKGSTVQIKKAIITAAGRNQRALPLQSLVDRDGVAKTALCILIEEVLNAGVDSVGMVIRPGDQAELRTAAGEHAPRLEFIEQAEPLGYGHAIWSARDFMGQEPCLLLVGDHLYVSRGERNCARQLIEVAQAEGCAVSAVQPTHESKLPYYGAIGGRRMPERRKTYLVEHVLEKPSPTQAEQALIVPGLRAGYYLCFFGMHVLTPGVMEVLSEQVQAAGARGGVNLSGALSKLAAREQYLAFEVAGRRYDIGLKYGLLTAQMALALEGKDRQEVLAQLVELLALRSE